ncbi:MAG: hypothetical protein AAF492_28135, partial [Verrucomicrobiota bacterium]
VGKEGYVDIIETLTAYLVRDHYYLLEKGSQALVALAHESVLDPEQFIEGGLSARLVDESAYLNHLRYDIRTRHEGPDAPFVRSVGIEGTDDVIKQGNRTGDEVGKDTIKLLAEQGRTIRKTANMDKEDYIMTVRTSAALIAAFQTAETLLAVKKLEPEVISLAQSGEDFHSSKFDRSMLDRAATVKLKVRALDRSGKIVMDEDIVGVAMERVVTAFWNAQKRL